MVEKKIVTQKQKIAEIPQDDLLDGMKAIKDYVKRSDSTVLKLIMQFDFPAWKECGSNIWLSSKKKIALWRAKNSDY